jgi:acyl dehydratase
MFEPSSTGQRFFEDIVLDQPMTFGAVRVSRDDIMTFARAYDPQPIHLDEAAAKASIVGGLCASGFHTCCLMMRMLCDHFLNTTASLGAPGLDEVKWLQPLRPDDVISVRIIADTKRVMTSRPAVGLVHVNYAVLNQNGDSIMTSSCTQLIRVRQPAPESTDRPARAPKAEVLDLWAEAPELSPVSSGQYFEERVLGETRVLGQHTFDTNEVIAFAKLYDPQPFHLDVAAGHASLFGGLSASGWHTACHFIRLVVADRQRQEQALRDQGRPVPAYGPSPGFKNLRWIKPVMVGDTIEYRQRTTGKVELKSRPDRGILQMVSQARNQHGQLVFDYHGAIFVERKPS